MRTTVLAGAAVLMFVTGSLYMAQKDRDRLFALGLKGGTTCVAFCISVWAGVAFGGWFAWLICLATLCCAVADVVLGMNFSAGAVVFGIGHLFYMAAYGTKVRIVPAWVLAVAVLAASMYFVHCRGKAALEKVGWVEWLYCILLSSMTAMAVLFACQRPGQGSLMTAVGAVCFFLSDNLLVKRLRTQDKGRAGDYAVMFFYYLAVYLIAAGGLFHGGL